MQIHKPVLSDTVRTDRLCPLRGTTLHQGNTTMDDAVTFNAPVAFLSSATIGDPVVNSDIANKQWTSSLVNSLVPELAAGQLLGWGNGAGANAPISAATATDQVLLPTVPIVGQGVSWKQATCIREIPAVMFATADAAMPPPTGTVTRTTTSGGTFSYGVVISLLANGLTPFTFVMPQDWVEGSPISIWLAISGDAGDAGNLAINNDIMMANTGTVMGASTTENLAIITGLVQNNLLTIRGYSTTLHPTGIDMTGFTRGALVSCVLVLDAALNTVVCNVKLHGAFLRYRAVAIDTTSTPY